MVVAGQRSSASKARPVRFHSASLDALNFLLSDVRGALGPYLNVFLITQQHWSQTSVGLVTMIGGWIGLAVQPVAGAVIDTAQAKRALIIAGLFILAVGATAIFVVPTFWTVMVANSAIRVVGDVFGLTVAAITLGIYRQSRLARRMGRNAAFDHAGNIAIAAVAGAVGWAFSQRAVFLLVPFFAVLATLAVLSIPPRAIDHERARGAAPIEGGGEKISGLSVLFTCRPLLIYAGCAMLFHFANAPLLPLVGQKLAIAHPAWGTAMMSSCIIAAQAIMLPIALFVGRTADAWGRKPILLIGFAILPVRAALYTLSDHATWLIGVQLLDGVGAGIFGAMTPLVLADLMRGTGRYNFAQGTVGVMQGIGASTSGLVAGLTVDHVGYSAAFLEASIVAGLALAVLSAFMPETARVAYDLPAALVSTKAAVKVSADLSPNSTT
jgi:MFS family permease